jgi:hypothetical protein
LIRAAENSRIEIVGRVALLTALRDVLWRDTFARRLVARFHGRKALGGRHVIGNDRGPGP